jgi:ferredoxin
MEVRVSREKCTNCMDCVEVCPEIFGLRESNVEIICKDVPRELIDKCHFASGLCPTSAIELIL